MTKKEFNQFAVHPLQSWEWEEFREKLGQKIIRLGEFSSREEGHCFAVQISIHRIPHTPWAIGYCPRGPMPTAQMIKAIKEEAKKYNCIFVKFEPNALKEEGRGKKEEGMKILGLRPGKPLFTQYSFQVDLMKSEKELLAGMKSKTRYNLHLAEKKGVIVEEDDSDEAFEAFQQLTEQTTKRQRFYAHGRRYRQLMWETMREAGIAHLMVARLREEGKRKKEEGILTAWIIFLFNKVGYYPYGASSDQHRELMASNLVAWNALLFAKKAGCKTFDFWGSLGPNPDAKDPWYGFHRFKEGYGGKLVEFIGTWDLVLNSVLYQIYNAADRVRWWILRKGR